MDNDAIGQVDLTGRWVGFYRYTTEGSGTFPIVAEIQQTGDKITGEMYDQVTDRSDRLDAILEKFRDDLTPGHKRRIEAVLRRYADEPLVHTSHLPDTSDIEGKCTSNLVRFTKTYRGAFEAALTAGEKTVRSITLARHQVFYSGQLDVGATCINGGWLIRYPGLLRCLLPPLSRGSFELYRKR